MLKSRFQSLRRLRNMGKDERTFAHVPYHIRACVVLHNIIIGLPDDEFWAQEDLPQLRAEWEAEATSIRTLMDRGGNLGEEEIFTAERGEDMRKALRYHFQATNYRRPYERDGDDF